MHRTTIRHDEEGLLVRIQNAVEVLNNGMKANGEITGKVGAPLALIISHNNHKCQFWHMNEDTS